MGPIDARGLRRAPYRPKIDDAADPIVPLPPAPRGRASWAGRFVPAGSGRRRQDFEKGGKLALSLPLLELVGRKSRSITVPEFSERLERAVIGAADVYWMCSVCTICCMDSRDIIKRLEADGWRLVRSKGSHRQYKHPQRPGLVTVPHPRKELPRGTLKSIFRQAGWRE